MKRERVLAICATCAENFRARHCITADFEISTSLEIQDQEIPPCIYEQLEKLRAIVEG